MRKSTREHFKPLEWWRGERYVYGREKGSGPVLVAPIKAIMRIPKEPPAPLGSKRKRSMRGRSKSRVIEQPSVVYNPEEGWDDDTADECMILEYPGGMEKLRRELPASPLQCSIPDETDRCWVHGEDVQATNGCEWWMEVPENLRRKRIHLCWTNNHSRGRSEAKQERKRQYIC